MAANVDLRHDRYQRSNSYDPAWVLENEMGPNALWLVEGLTEKMTIEEGMRVLDLGCGRGLTSIFLAKEFGAQVWAADLWIPATDNQQRVAEASSTHAIPLTDRVFPLNAEAHALPFASEFFDAIISVDAYQYFGTADLYLGYLIDFLKPGGQIGAVMPALAEELGAEVPKALAPYWEWDFCAFHSPQWWGHHWAKTGLVTVDHASWIEDGWKDWLRFNDATMATVTGWRVDAAKNTHDMLAADQGQNLGFTRITATKPSG